MVTLVNYIIGSLELDEEAIEVGDINQDDDINVLDIVTLVNIILNS